MGVQVVGAPKRLLVKRQPGAVILGCSVTQMMRYERDGLLRPIRLIGRDVYYEVAQIEALAAEAIRNADPVAERRANIPVHAIKKRMANRRKAARRVIPKGDQRKRFGRGAE
jgi:hypothetical protein